MMAKWQDVMLWVVFVLMMMLSGVGIWYGLTR